MSLWSQLAVVCRKELKDAMRDRRAVLTLVIGALFSPLIMGFMFNRLADRQRQLDEVTIPIVGAQHAPALVDWLGQQTGVTITEGPADAEAAVRESREDVVVVIPEDFQEKFRGSSPAPVKIVSDGSRQTARPRVQRVRGLFQRFNSEIGTLRLVNRGVSPVIATPLRLEDVEVSSAQQRAAQILSFISFFLILAAFTGSMSIAMDATAGERERGSLEPLLVSPAPRGAFAGGKWLAAVVSSMLGVALTTVLLLAVLQFIPLQEFGVRFRLQPQQIGMMLAAALPMSFLAAAVQTYFATFAKSFKEAQSYMGYLLMVPMLPGIVSMVYPINAKWWMYPIPILGQQVLTSDVVAAKPTPWWAFVLGAASAVMLSLVLVQMTTRLLQRERIIFSR